MNICLVGRHAISRETLLNTVSGSGECSEGGKIEQGGGESVNRGMFQQEGKQRCQYGGSLKKQQQQKNPQHYHMIQQSHYWDPEKTAIQKDTFTQMFLVALFTIARTWKQFKFCPSTDE